MSGASAGSAAFEDELARQVQVLVHKGYPALSGMTVGAFVRLCEAARASLPRGSTRAGGDRATAVPFLLVVKSELVPTVRAVDRFDVRGKAGFTDMTDDLASFRPIDGVVVPDASVYLVLDVDTGADTLNVAPNDALPRLVAAGRTPLTIDEGVALVTQRPDVFATLNAFQALGSRADASPLQKRVPSFWMSKGAPRLGWCWAGNPHSWLGAASAARRV